MAAEFIIVAAGALAAGVVTGLVGFGTGLTALGFWLQVIEPTVAAPWWPDARLPVRFSRC